MLCMQAPVCVLPMRPPCRHPHMPPCMSPMQPSHAGPHAGRPQCRPPVQTPCPQHTPDIAGSVRLPPPQQRPRDRTTPAPAATLGHQGGLEVQGRRAVTISAASAPRCCAALASPCRASAHKGVPGRGVQPLEAKPRLHGVAAARHRRCRLRRHSWCAIQAPPRTVRAVSLLRGTEVRESGKVATSGMRKRGPLFLLANHHGHELPAAHPDDPCL